MPDSLQILGPYQALEPEVMKAMLDLSGLKNGEKYIDLGSGDGQFLKEAELRGAVASGVELDTTLANQCKAEGLKVTQGNLFDTDVSKMDVITFWFTGPDVVKLMDKLYAEMKTGARLVCASDNRKQYRQGVFIPEESGAIHLKNLAWQPPQSIAVSATPIGNHGVSRTVERLIHIYVR